MTDHIAEQDCGRAIVYVLDSRDLSGGILTVDNLRSIWIGNCTQPTGQIVSVAHALVGGDAAKGVIDVTRRLAARSYCVSTVGLDEAKVRQYIRHQEETERRQEEFDLDD